MNPVQSTINTCLVGAVSPTVAQDEFERTICDGDLECALEIVVARKQRDAAYSPDATLQAVRAQYLLVHAFF